MITSATISLAHNLGLKVVAEGVETRAQKGFLLSLKYDYLQGYLYSPAVAEDKIMPLLNHSLS